MNRHPRRLSRSARTAFAPAFLEVTRVANSPGDSHVIEVVEQRDRVLPSCVEKVLEPDALQSFFMLKVLDENRTGPFNRLAMEDQVSFNTDQPLLLPQGVQDAFDGCFVGSRPLSQVRHPRRGE